MFPWTILLLIVAYTHASSTSHSQQVSSSDTLATHTALDSKPTILPIPDSSLSISLTIHSRIPLPIPPLAFLEAEYDELMLKPWNIIERAYLKTDEGLTLHLHLDRHVRIRNLDLAGACEVMGRVLRTKGEDSTLEFYLLSDEGANLADGGLEPAVTE